MSKNGKSRDSDDELENETIVHNEDESEIVEQSTSSLSNLAKKKA
jgi:hypothetical protein